MGNIGEPGTQEEIELEPFPESEPIKEPAPSTPAPAPAEPEHVPA